MNGLSRRPSDEEWAALGELFAQPGGPNRDGIFGLMHAVATAPSMIPPSAWLPVALGDRALDGQLTVIAILRHYNEIVDGMAAGEPLVPPPTDADAIRDWCVGYMSGVNLDPAWHDDFDAIATLFPIGVLAGETPLNTPDDENPIDDEEGWLREARENLGGVALEAYEVLGPVRRARAGRPPVQRPIRRGPKVGRNDPCPCGSGKKHKKCCLHGNG